MFMIRNETESVRPVWEELNHCLYVTLPWELMQMKPIPTVFSIVRSIVYDCFGLSKCLPKKTMSMW